MQKAERDGSKGVMITISRSLWPGLQGIGFALACCGGVAGCAAPAPRVVSPGPEAVTIGRVDATVVAVRPVPPAAPQGGGAILAALGSPGAAPPDEAEIVLRTDQGDVLSVVQSGTAGLMPGARVVVLTSPRLQIVRPGYSTPAS